MDSCEKHEEETILPGIKPVLEILQSEPGKVDMVYVRRGRVSPETENILDACRRSGVRFSLVDEAAMARLSRHAGHQGVAARLRSAGLIAWEELLEGASKAPLPLIVALDQVLDPGNVGTLARTLYAMGGAGLVLPGTTALFLVLEHVVPLLARWSDCLSHRSSIWPGPWTTPTNRAFSPMLRKKQNMLSIRCRSV